jgi:hypothetical protein
MGHFSGYFERASTFLTPKLSLARSGQFRVKKVLVSGTLIVTFYICAVLS